MKCCRFIACCLIFALGLICASSVHARAEEYPLPSEMRIADIIITGNYPYIESKVKRYLTIRAGWLYDEAVINEQVSKIIEFYEREGWLGTNVTAESEYNPDYEGMIVKFRIRRGVLLRYRKIGVTGKYSLPASLVASKINVWKAFTPRRLRESVRKIVEVYRDEGYPLARVTAADKAIDIANHRIDVVIDIDEGPRVRVKFMGNRHLGGRRLRKAITIFSEGAIDTYELEASAKAIRKKYRNSGYPDAAVSFVRREVGSGEIDIVFNIEEGKPQRVRKIEFTGNREMGSGRLRGRMFTKQLSLTKRGLFHETVLKGDVKRIEEYYRSKGFLEAKVEEPRIERVNGGTQLIITMPVEEGQQTFIRKIFFEGDVKFPEKELQDEIKLKVDDPLDATILDEERARLILFYADRGYPYAQVSVENLMDESDRTAALSFVIDTGPEAVFGPITIAGDFLTSQKAIRRAVGIKEGEPYSAKKLANAEAALRRIGAFASADIKPIGLGDGAAVIPLAIQIEELRPFRLDFDIGYSTAENFIATMNFTNLNAFGWGKSATFRLIGGKRLSRGEIGWVDPKFVGSDIEMTMSGWMQYENRYIFNYIQTGGGIGFFRRFHRTSFWAKEEVDRNYFVQGSSTAADAESLRNNTISKTSFSASFDTRDSFADPTDGFCFMGYSDFFNEIRGNEAHFVKFGTMDGAYVSFLKYVTFANDVRFDNIQTFGKNVSVPSNALLLLGGDDTIRGFDQYSLGPVNAAGNPTGGRLRFVMNNEFRFKLIDNFKFAVFHDMGFLTDFYRAVTLATLRHSAGAGLRYITPIGPIKLDYGIILDRQPGEHFGKLHITFGYAF